MRGNKLLYNYRKKIYLVFASILIFSLYAIVDTSGFPDLPIYEYVFEHIVRSGEIMLSYDVLEFEKGYLWLNIILKHISDNYIVLRLVIAGFIVISLMRATYVYSDITWMTLILFMCILMYPTIYTLRQSVSIFIFLCSIRYIINRNLVKYLICIFIAFLFHKSVIVCVFLYFIYPLRINLKNLLLFVLFFVFLLFSMLSVLNFIGGYIIDVNPYILEDGETSSIRQLIIPFLTLLFILLCYRGQLNTMDGKNKLFLWMIVINCGISFLYYSSTVFNQFYRLNYYFSFGTIYLIPNAICAIKTKYIKNISMVMWTLFWLAYIMIIINMQYGF